MLPRPGIFSILKNDSWAAPMWGGFIVALVATLIVLATERVTGSLPKNVNVWQFFALTGAFGLAAVVISLYRVRYVTEVFENGVVVIAEVLEVRSFKSSLTLKLRYIYRAQTHEKKLEQVITGKTQKLMCLQQAALVIDQSHPERILLRDAYL